MFQVGPPPLAPPKVAAPAAPAMRPVVPDAKERIKVEADAAIALPDFGARSLGILGFEPAFGVVERQGFLDHALIMTALDAGIRHVVDLGPAPLILVAVNQEKSGGGVRTSTWMAGQMSQMARIADVARVDYVLVGHFGAMEKTKDTIMSSFELTPDELAAYGGRYQRFRAESEENIRAFGMARQGYIDEFGRASAAYQSEKAKANPLSRIWMDDSAYKARVAAYEQFVAESSKDLLERKTAERAVPPPDQYRPGVQANGEQNQVSVSLVELTVKLIEAKSGQVVWAARLSQISPRDVQANAEEVLARLLDELRPKNGGRRRR